MLKRTVFLVTLGSAVMALWLQLSWKTKAAMVPTSAMTSSALSEWALSRDCLYTADAEQLLVDVFVVAWRELDTRQVNPALESYLDTVTLRSFGPLRTSCVVNANLLQASPFSVPDYAGPKKAYLTVNGTMRGAAIRINGQLKGHIVTTFALSPGEYRVQTMKCDERLRIAPNDHKRMFCDKR